MILIFSYDPELSTNRVINWIKFFGGKYIRIRPEDVLYKTVVFDNTRICLKKFDDYSVSWNEIKAVWYRKWDLSSCFNFLNESSLDTRNSIEIDYHFHSEYRVYCEHFYYLLRDKNWLSKPSSTKLNKLNVLSSANELGIKTPNTCVTNSKSELNTFFSKNNSGIITKTLGNAPDVMLKDNGLTLYTNELTKEDFGRIPEFFYPSLFQSKIEKKYEVRSFYLDGKFYSMAIFSQTNYKTQVDFRHYDDSKPNQVSAYQLPRDLESKLDALMKKLGLDTGSIDLIKDMNGDYVFLEVNPTGQYDMVSYPCNYHLDKKIAEALINRASAI